MNHVALEDINLGLALAGEISILSLSADDFTGDRAKAVKLLQKKGAAKEDITKILGPSIINAATHAVENWNGSKEILDWPEALRKASRGVKLSAKLRKTADRLEENEDVDLMPVYGEMTEFVAQGTSGLTLAKDIDYKTYKPFMKSGYKPIDDIIGGIPTDGPIVVFGAQGTGKSFFSANSVSCLLKAHKEKTAGIYTLEMSAEHYMYRSMRMYPDLEKSLDRLYVSGSVHNVEELIAEVTTKRLDFVVIDDMDRMVKSVDPAAYQITYFRLAEICRFLKIPVMILAQPNRAAKLGKQFLCEWDISWSSAGENSAALLIALQVANDIDLADDKYPLTSDNRPFMIFLKSRDGWPKQQGPGAIRLDGGSPNQLWSGTPYSNKLYPAHSERSKIGKDSLKKANSIKAKED